MLGLLAIVALAARLAHGATVMVTVGPDLAFHPNTVEAAIGDDVQFNFASGPNSASEATARLNDPCNTEGGFDSGIQEAGGSSTILITTQNSIYVFSSPHCTQGMVMIVNPGPNDSVAKYMQVAEASGGNSSPAPAPAPAPAAVTTTSTPAPAPAPVTTSSSSTTQPAPVVVSPTTVVSTPSTPSSSSSAAASSAQSSATPTTGIASTVSTLSLMPITTPLNKANSLEGMTGAMAGLLVALVALAL